MTALLSVDGPVYRALSGWWWLSRIGLIWLAGCLPVVTAPVSTLWLLDSVQRQLAGRPQAGRVETLSLLKQLSWPALRLFALHGFVLALLLSAALGPSPGELFDVVLPAVVLCVGVTWLLLTPWSVALLLRRRRGVIDAIVRAYLISIRSPLLAVTCLVGLALGATVLVLTPSQIAVLVVLTVPGLAACLLVATCDRADAAASSRLMTNERSDR